MTDNKVVSNECPQCHKGELNIEKEMFGAGYVVVVTCSKCDFQKPLKEEVGIEEDAAL